MIHYNIKKLSIVFLFIVTVLNAKQFKVVSYNVENLFDMTNNHTEYKEYKPNTRYWNNKILITKLKNIARVLKDIDGDIVALQEIESKKALILLSSKLPRYKYKTFLKNSKSAVGVAILSKFPFKSIGQIVSNKKDKYQRPIQKVVIDIDGRAFTIYNNHFRSKRAKESKRIKYATSLMRKLPNDNTDYIILGDFNENYNEWQTFKHNRKLNDTYGITAINHILNTTIDNRYVDISNIMKLEQKAHYNLWLELSKSQRFSAKYGRQKETPDNMLLPRGMFDSKNISYILNSFEVFKPTYLYKNNKIQRWNKTKGYSDHLPIVATFNTSSRKILVKYIELTSDKISHLYNIDTVTKPIKLSKVVVVYKHKKGIIFKQKNNKAVYAYIGENDLILGGIYDIVVDEIELYHGLLEISSIGFVKWLGRYKNYKSLFVDGAKIDIFDKKYINNIVTNLKGRYQNRYLYLENGKKIKIFFAKNIIQPRNNVNITIQQGHIATYKGQTQITIHKQSDIL